MSETKLLKRLKLSRSDLTQIKKAVSDAERNTNGEIAIAAIRESSDYSFFELFAAVIFGAICFAILLPLHGSIETMIGKLFWIEKAWYLPAFYGIACFATIAIVFCASNVPAIDRIVIPRFTRKARVYNRAIRHFAESGVYATKDRTGILLFISLMEREVRIVADKGISEKIEQSEWDKIASSLAEGIRDGKTCAAIVSTIDRCGTLLSEHFPAKKENPNELPDGLVILEAGE
jgi:putative membrane protein